LTSKQKHDLGKQKRDKNELLNPLRLTHFERTVKRKLDRSIELEEDEREAAIARGWRVPRRGR
jgi:hypothetical protein